MIGKVEQSLVCIALVGLCMGAASASDIQLAGSSISMAELSQMRNMTQKLSLPERCANYESRLLEKLNENPNNLSEREIFDELSVKVYEAGNKSLASYLDECARFLGGNGVDQAYVASGRNPNPEISSGAAVNETATSSGGSELDKLREQLDYEHASARAEQEVIKAGLIRYELEIEKLKREVAAKDESLRRMRAGEDIGGVSQKTKCQLDLENARGEQARALVRADSCLNDLLRTRKDLGLCEASLRGSQAEHDQCKKDLAASSSVARTGLAAAFQSPLAAQCEAEKARLKQELAVVSQRNVVLSGQYNSLNATLNSAPRI